MLFIPLILLVALPFTGLAIEQFSYPTAPNHPQLTTEQPEQRGEPFYHDGEEK